MSYLTAQWHLIRMYTVSHTSVNLWYKKAGNKLSLMKLKDRNGRELHVRCNQVSQLVFSRDIIPGSQCRPSSLRKQAYSNIMKILPPKQCKFSDKKFWYFHISAQNTDFGYSLEPPWQGGSNEYPHSMFLSRNKKNNVYPCKVQFSYIKMGFKGVSLYRHVFLV